MLAKCFIVGNSRTTTRLLPPLIRCSWSSLSCWMTHFSSKLKISTTLSVVHLHPRGRRVAQTASLNHKPGHTWKHFFPFDPKLFFSDHELIQNCKITNTDTQSIHDDINNISEKEKTNDKPNYQKPEWKVDIYAQHKISLKIGSRSNSTLTRRLETLINRNLVNHVLYRGRNTTAYN